MLKILFRQHTAWEAFHDGPVLSPAPWSDLHCWLSMALLPVLWLSIHMGVSLSPRRQRCGSGFLIPLCTYPSLTLGCTIVLNEWMMSLKEKLVTRVCWLLIQDTGRCRVYCSERCTTISLCHKEGNGSYWVVCPSTYNTTAFFPPLASTWSQEWAFDRAAQKKDCLKPLPTWGGGGAFTELV
jgi:hypothetical protein